MKTILQIAREIGVSKQSVYKRFKGKLYTEVCPYIHTENGTTYILEQGENIIKTDFLKDNDIPLEHIRSTSDPHTERIQDTLICMLQDELEAKNKQIEELSATIRIQAESINALHHSQLAETIIEGKLPSPQKKSSFFSKIFLRSREWTKN